MEEKIKIVYLGDLRCKTTDCAIGRQIVTDAPQELQGMGEAFSPVDLVSAALASCMLTMVAITAQKNGIDIKGAAVEVSSELTHKPVMRIKNISVNFIMSAGIDKQKREELKIAATNCPVYMSLHPDICVTLDFHYPD